MLIRIYEPRTLKVKALYSLYEYEIDNDYISDPVSKFSLVGDDVKSVVKIGDLVEVFEEMRTPNRKEEPISHDRDEDIFRPYVGVIKTFDGSNTIQTVLPYNLFNANIMYSYLGGVRDFVTHMGSLNRTEYNLPKLKIRLNNSVRPDQYFFIYEPETKFSVKSIKELLISLYKQLDVVALFSIGKRPSLEPETNYTSTDMWVESFGDDPFQYGVGMGISSYDDPADKYLHIDFYYYPLLLNHILIKDNSDAFMNWDVQLNKEASSNFNKVSIVHPESKEIIAEYWSNKYGKVLNYFDASVMDLPVNNTYIEHNEEYTLLQEATSVLASFRKSMNVTVDIDFENQHLVNRKQLIIGKPFTISYGGQEYKLRLSGFKFSSQSKLITLMFGYDRPTLQNIFRRYKL